jgi:hypothetical protein
MLKTSHSLVAGGLGFEPAVAGTPAETVVSPSLMVNSSDTNVRVSTKPGQLHVSSLYRITTDALENPRLSEKDLEARVERVAETEPTDGLWIDGRGRLYLSAIEQDAVKVREGDRITTLVQDKRLRWPDTFSEGPDGTIYVTSSRIQDM